MPLHPHVLFHLKRTGHLLKSAFSLLALGYMTEQLQFSIGDDVRYVSSSKYDYRAPGTYRIVRLRPSETPDCQYWIRSALENFDRIAFRSEIGLIAPTATKRVATQFITILAPFKLKAMEQEWPPGVYEITTTEEPIGDFMYEAYRRISTTIYLPPRSADYGIGKIVETDPAELEILTRSARHD
jgi:hypothetical protein